jgi:hypothetical protein
MVLFIGCAFMHFVALLKMDITNRQFVLMDATAIHEIRIIDFIDAHRWIAFMYVGASLFTATWLTIKAAPQWVFRVSSLAYAVPCLIYLRMCEHIDTKFVDWGAFQLNR